jgi:enoyl-CoA hydratase
VIPATAVRCDTNESYVRIGFDRPPVNAFTVETLVQLCDVIEAFAADARPLVLVGTGGVFSAGFDTKQDVSVETAVEHASRCLMAIQAHPTPIIAAVEGAAVGLGLLIATSADILVVSRAARLRMPEVTLGITSDVAPLRRYLPDPWIRRMCLLGDVISAEDLHLDNAGAIVCDPGRAEETATSLLVAMTAIDADFLKRTKRGLYR